MTLQTSEISTYFVLVLTRTTGLCLIRPRLGTKTRPAALKSLSQAALADNGVFN